MSLCFTKSQFTRWVFVIGLGFVGCSSQPEVPDAALELAGERGIPEWAVETPREPGEAFYGVGRGEARMIESLAVTDAEAAARADLARALGVTVESVLQRYLSEVVANDPESPDARNGEALLQDTTRIVTQLSGSGFEIVQRVPTEDGRYWALARVGFDDVAEQLHSISQERYDSVRRNSTKAFEELDRILEEQSRTP